MTTTTTKSRIGSWLAVVAVGSLIGACGPSAGILAPGPSPSDAPAAPDPSPSATPTPPGWPQIFATTGDGVARIAVTTCDGGGSGSGFLVAHDVVLTVAHVVENTTSVSLRFGSSVYAGKPFWIDSANDLALVHVDGARLEPVFAVAENAAPVGADVAVIGYPLGKPIAMTQGAVTSVDLRVDVDGHDMRGLFRTDTAINPGNSGGPVLDDYGHVVGVVTAASGYAGEGFAVSQPAVLEAVSEAQNKVRESIAPARCESSADDAYGGPPVEVTVTSGSPEAASIAQAIQLYAQAINDRYFSLLWDLLTPAMRDRVGSLEGYAEGLSTSYWVAFDVLEVEAVDDTTDRAVISARTEQAAEYGHDGQTCSDWAITYTLVLDAGYWQIDGVQRTAGLAPTPCPGAGDGL